MDLIKAIVRVSKFALKPKDEGPDAYKQIRFLPAINEADTPKLFATNGTFGVVVTLDKEIEIQNACCPADLCLEMARESGAILEMGWVGKAIEFKARRKKGTTVSTFTLPSGNVSTFPSYQTPPPEMHYVSDWGSIDAVTHAAGGKGIDNEIFRCVRFLENTVEATDRFRLARAEMDTKCEGLVPKELFASWPKGDVFAGFNAVYGFFRVGDELRYTQLMQGKYANTAQLIPEEHQGEAVLCDIESFLSVVKQAVKMHKAKVVQLEFADGSLNVSSWTDRDDQKLYAKLPAKTLASSSLGGFISLVSGKNLLEALKALKTPRVIVGYGHGPKDLLRLESGRVTICLWPMLDINTGVEDGRQD